MKPYDGLTSAGQARRIGRLAGEALDAWGLNPVEVRGVHHFHNTTLRVRSDDGVYAMRVARPAYQSDAALASEVAFLEHLVAGGLPVPVPVRTTAGEPFACASSVGVPEPRRCMLFRWIDGKRPRDPLAVARARRMGSLVARMHSLVTAFEPPPGFKRRRLDADTLAGSATGFVRNAVRARLDAGDLATIDAATEKMRSAFEDEREHGLVHADVMPGNTLWRGRELHLIDFDDMGWAPLAYDLAVVRWAVDRDEVWTAFLGGYEAIRALPPGSHEDLVAGRRVLVALWLAGNFDHPSFAQAREWISSELEHLRTYVAG